MSQCLVQWHKHMKTKQPTQMTQTMTKHMPGSLGSRGCQDNCVGSGFAAYTAGSGLTSSGIESPTRVKIRYKRSNANNMGGLFCVWAFAYN